MQQPFKAELGSWGSCLGSSLPVPVARGYTPGTFRCSDLKAIKPTAKGRSKKAQRASDAQELAPPGSLHPLLPPNPAGPGVQRARVMLIPHCPSFRLVVHLNFHVQFQWALPHPLPSAPSARTSVSPRSVAVSSQNNRIAAPRALLRLPGLPARGALLPRFVHPSTTGGLCL